MLVKDIRMQAEHQLARPCRGGREHLARGLEPRRHLLLAGALGKRHHAVKLQEQCTQHLDCVVVQLQRQPRALVLLSLQHVIQDRSSSLFAVQQGAFSSALLGDVDEHAAHTDYRAARNQRVVVGKVQPRLGRWPDLRR
jgi:hypothetical protein